MKRRSSRMSVKISSKYCSLALDIRHQEWYRNAVREKHVVGTIKQSYRSHPTAKAFVVNTNR